MTTYLQLVNAVLLRLRESSVASVSTSTYSQLIGAFINESKRQVEDAWNWDALNTAITVTTASGTSTYTVTGSGRRHKSATINDTTNDSQLRNVPLQWIKDQQQLTTTTNAQPEYYAWNGTDGTDSKIELFPTPDGTYSLSVNLYVPQIDLSSDADVLTIQSEAVIAGAFARALVERGEDGGLSSGEAYGLYKGILADQIALDATRFGENDCWVAV
jgi:hypothetical protein